MKYQDKNFQRLQERQKKNPKESKRDFLIRNDRYKIHLRFYNETANKIFDTESWYSFTDKQRDEIIRSHKRLVTKSNYFHFIGLNLTNSFFVDERDWINMVKEEYKPNYALIRSRRLKKIGI